MELFPRDQVVGIFRGFSEGGLEFHADLVFPYRSEFQSIPMHGQFVLVQLEGNGEAVLGRISSLSADGKLATSPGEDFSLRAVNDDREVPEDLREQYLKYRVNIRVLGVLRSVQDKLTFVPSQRRLPHVGSKVAFLGGDVLREVAGHNRSGAPLGHFALGEFVYAGGDSTLKLEDWMRIRTPDVVPKFDVSKLVSRRSFIFARAGFGKSNLAKLLFSGLYATAPQIETRTGGKVPVGTIVFDIDGEYFWPDVHNRPGLCDVEALEDKVVVFTNREAPSAFYGSFVAGGIKLDIRRFRPADVMSIALSQDKQDQQNVRKLKGMNDADWKALVDAIYRDKNATDLEVVMGLLKLEKGQEAEALAARANVTTVLSMLHDPSNQTIDTLVECLRAGKLVIFDVSQMRGQPALILSGLILQRIFDINQQEFIKKEPRHIPTIAVLEEAQTVLGDARLTNDSPYVAWVKEGRKYDLGAVLITQQPGSIASELLSQGDNWFAFHLLSEGDLMSVRRANAHFSNDLLSSLLNEPIPGHVVFWSSVGGTPYPLPIRILSFEELHKVRDRERRKGPAERSFALGIRERQETDRRAIQEELEPGEGMIVDSEGEEQVDDLEMKIRRAIRQFGKSVALQRLRTYKRTPYRAIVTELENGLIGIADSTDKNKIAYANVPRALDEAVGAQNKEWHTETERGRRDPSRNTVWVVLGPEKAKGPM